jgi:hypothetical protein
VVVEVGVTAKEVAYWVGMEMVMGEGALAMGEGGVEVKVVQVQVVWAKVEVGMEMGG